MVESPFLCLWFVAQMEAAGVYGFDCCWRFCCCLFSVIKDDIFILIVNNDITIMGIIHVNNDINTNIINRYHYLHDPHFDKRFIHIDQS